MKLRNKILSILGVGLVGLSASFYAVSNVLFNRSYAELENQQMNQSVQRVLDTLSGKLNSLSRQALDYGRWDDTYEFIVDRNPDYIEANFVNLHIADLELNAIVYVDSSGEIVYAQGADLDQRQEVPVSAELLRQLQKPGPLTTHPDSSSRVMGLIQLPEGLMLITSNPITRSVPTGSIRGSLIVGRYINPSYIQEISELTRLPRISIEPVNAPQLTEDLQRAYQALSDSNAASSVFVRPSSREHIAGYALLEDLHGEPISLVQVAEPRSIYLQGKTSLRYLILAIGLTGAAFSFFILLFLEKSVLSRLARLNQGVSEAGSSRDLSTRVTLEGEDELAGLAITFNSVLDQLQQFQTTLQENAAQLQRQNRTIAELSHDESLVQGNFVQAVKIVVEATADTLNIDRVSVWLSNDNQPQLTCLDSYDRVTQQHTTGMLLSEAETLQSFEATQDDAVNDPAINHHSITSSESVLDVPIQIAGRRVGMIRCEQTGTRRDWQPEERTFVYSIANLMALTLESETLQSEVGQILDTVSLVESGDLTVQAQVSDRVTGLVSDILNQLIERLAEVLNQVLDASQQVASSTNQQKELAATIATNAEQQAQAVSQILLEVERVEQTAQESAAKVQSSNAALRTAAKTIEQEQTAITNLTQRIDVLQDGTDQIMQQMKTLGEFVGLTDQFVQDQGQVAFLIQTLSLNASLVAARASEQRDPRQFVVVAREFEAIAEQVRRLAEQTNEGLSTLEQRSSQIHTVFSVIDKSVQGLGELVSQFTQGVQQSYRVFGTVQSVTADTVQTGEAVAEFSQRIVASAQSTAQVVRAIAETVTDTADLTLISQEQSQRIDELTTQLLQTVQFFQLPQIGDRNGKMQLRQDYPEDYSEQDWIDSSPIETATIEIESIQDFDSPPEPEMNSVETKLINHTEPLYEDHPTLEDPQSNSIPFSHA
ncbi:CHASE4 domain-containing protein [Egbenema bharatensis]|uniref:CHASE4 domain-containing protein n=1 Tax=Egbenema bharatensis TaxID=3463334 RepID=UPI003A838F68